MARLPRFALPGQPQHVIQRGNNRSPLFLASRDYAFFRRCLAIACARHRCQVHAYVLMTNHVHLLMTPQDAAAIGKAMQSVGRRYVGYFNAAYERTGTLWEGRYRSAPVDSERYLLTCYRYIELNPVRAGLVLDPGDYRWSSYRANALAQRDAVVTPHERFSSLGSDPASRRAAYRALFEQTIGDALLDEIREATNKRWVLGSDVFKAEMAARAGRRAQPAQAGGARTGAGRPRGTRRFQRSLTPLILDNSDFNGV